MRQSLDPEWFNHGLEIYDYGRHADDELEDIELGERVGWWLVYYRLAGLHSDPGDAAAFTARAIFGSVCDAVRGMTGRQDVTGLVPREWLPRPLGEEEKHG